MKRGIRRAIGWAILGFLLALLVVAMTLHLDLFHAVGILLGAFALVVLLIVAVTLILE